MILPNLSSGQWITRCIERPLLTHSSNFFFSCDPNHKKKNLILIALLIAAVLRLITGALTSSFIYTGGPGGEIALQFFEMLWRDLSSSFLSTTPFSWSLMSSCCWIFHFKKNASICVLLALCSQVLSGCSFCSKAWQ